MKESNGMLTDGRTLLLLAAACTLLAVLGALQLQYLVWDGTLRYNAGPPGFWGFLYPRLVYWYWAGILVIPLSWVLTRPALRRIDGTSLVLHLLTAAAFLSLLPVLPLVVDRLLDLRERPFLEAYRQGFFRQIESRIIHYAVISGAVLGWDYQRRYRRQERRSAALQTRNAELKASLTEAELRALRMQLQPHFLFNSLHAVSSLVQRDAAAARRMIARISDFLRIILAQEGRQQVTLEEELDLLDRYFEIESLRFSDRLEVRLDANEESSQGLVPYLLLQPLAENAVRHALRSRSAMGRVEVWARRRDGRLKIRVSDNGSEATDGENRQSPGLGLQNTRQRLEKLHPGDFSLDLRHDPAGGTRVEVDLPFLYGGEEAA
ncbi:MAG TPA: histidine kinase [Acidobacteriota bacterium]|nr:histidine kinase [Acidobacteriota bacterium]